MPDTIRDNTALSRFELEDGGVTAFMIYRVAGDVITFLHTETPVAARGLKVVPRCAFVLAYLAKHPEFRDVVAAGS